MRVVGGKVMMDRNAPEAVRDTPQSSYDDSKTVIERWHGRGRALCAVSPRFAITSSPAQLEMAGALVHEHPDAYVQTHLAETHDEIAFAASLYPQARDYLDIYEALRAARAAQPVRTLPAPARAGTRGDGGERVGGGVLSDLEPVSRQRAVRRRRPRCLRACGGRSRRTWAAGRTTRCSARSTRATRCWPSGGRSSIRSGRSGGSRGATPRRWDWPTASARWRRGRRRTWWCWTVRRPRQWRSAWRRSRRWPRSLFVLETLGDDRSVAATYVAGELSVTARP